jgi:hypothetical protein
VGTVVSLEEGVSGVDRLPPTPVAAVLTVGDTISDHPEARVTSRWLSAFAIERTACQLDVRVH